MFLKDFVGKEIALVLNASWRDQRPNLCRTADRGNSSELTVSLEKLAGVDDHGVWIERSGDEHLLNYLQPIGQEGEIVTLTMNICVPWPQIVQVGVIIDGTFRSATELPIIDSEPTHAEPPTLPHRFTLRGRPILPKMGE